MYGRTIYITDEETEVQKSKANFPRTQLLDDRQDVNPLYLSETTTPHHFEFAQPSGIKSQDHRATWMYASGTDLPLV